MTSKEALDYLTSKVFTGGNSILEAEAEICKKIILERLEILERNSDKVIKDSVKLINKNLALEQENEKLKNENQILNQNIKDTYDTSQEIIYELTQENEKLKKALDVFAKLLQIESGLQESWLQFKNGDDQSDDLELEEFKLLKDVLENKI